LPRTRRGTGRPMMAVRFTRLPITHFRIHFRIFSNILPKTSPFHWICSLAMRWLRILSLLYELPLPIYARMRAGSASLPVRVSE
jgi:uncharacterized membrane protein